MANVIRSYDGQFLTHNDIEFIAHCIESHMGQWNTDRKSKTVLPKPMDEYQQFVHLADYLASRKDLTMAFEGYEQAKVELPDVNEYKFTFGRHSGRTIPEVAAKDMGWLTWAKENLSREPEKTLINNYLKSQEDEI
jgi:hypothetical protein